MSTRAMSEGTHSYSIKSETLVSNCNRSEESTEDSVRLSGTEAHRSGDLVKILTQHFEPEDAIRMNANMEKTETFRSGHESAPNRSIISRIFTNKPNGGIDLPPDGGYGWICCICVTLIMFSTWGANCAFGVYLAYYFNNGVFEGASKYDYALVAGMTVAFGQGMAPMALFLTRVMGCKGPMYIGITFMFLGLLLATFATKLWQLYLTQGVLIGISNALLYAPATTILPGWFLKKRSLALGFSLTGTGAGGVTYSMTVSKLIQETGDQRWPLRVMAIACTLTSIVATLLLRQKNPIQPCGYKSWTAIKEQFHIIFSMRVATMYNVELVAVWFAFALFGYNLMVFTLSPYAVAKGLSPDQAALLTTCLNAAQCVGRPSMGYLGDRFGRINITVTLTTVLTIFTFAFWLTCHNFVQLLFFSICIGSCVGVANVMSTVLIADSVHSEDFLPAWSFVNSLGSPFLLVCEVIAQSLTNPTNRANPYLHTQVFAGLCFFCALMLILLLREISVRLKLETTVRSRPSSIGVYESDSDQQAAHSELDEKHSMHTALLEKGPRRFLERMFHVTKV
ncbi:MCT family MFS transporter LALA0_S01e19284g [Lachancea lanzarotensis]|uniref:LALA0S01e19284g1_1 n=1 Tax=Lachancea lanzarotensis TaxID=1245769 RepID=A0A0C7MLU1_9SACH|nr:uncharacterized protein LALA0_S01e19284g [Lachancea lanzarotensis]CEP60801.1 LALA0S01e19284g1_1 [Lachancea lanzarotensis]